MHAPRPITPHCKRMILGAGTLLHWCGCQRWGSNPSPTYFATRIITRAHELSLDSIYIKHLENSGFGSDLQLGKIQTTNLKL